MTVTIKCQHTGFEFEAQSKRSKNFPGVSDLLNEANKDGRSYTGAYQKVKDLFADTKDEFSSAEEAISKVREMYEAWKRDDAPRFHRKTNGDRIREQKDFSNARRAENSALKANGYYWECYDVGTEDSHMPGSYGGGWGEFSHKEFQLFDKDGNKVSKRNALSAIGYQA